MDAIVVYESVFGNTRAIAQAIAEGLGSVPVLPVQEVTRLTAAFDTRLDKSPWLTGVAARGIARRLRRRGVDVVATESFLVEDSEGPLEDGELDRARAWGAKLASAVVAA